ncbi:hypothetical protein [Bernardetia sp. MNP-M8]|uniref:hypothetical protein n=1 Tax=Bernardetia sp. MNP-M8 TaxID=3127470 RepID=UPI0030CBF4F4
MKTITILLVLFLSISCSGTIETVQSNDLVVSESVVIDSVKVVENLDDTITYSQLLEKEVVLSLPYKKIALNSHASSTNEGIIESYYKDKSFLMNPLNALFSDSTSFRIADQLNELTPAYEHSYPYIGKAFFLERLPDIHTFKALVFIYTNSNQDYYLPYLELQLLDSSDTITDKLIIVGSRAYECSWRRSCYISKSYTIEITDKELCYDMMNDVTVSENIFKTKYQVSQKGKFVEIKK